MEHAPLDRSIINLRILGKVPPNARLRTNRNFIEHDQDTLQSYKRWRDREGRVNNRRALRELTDDAIRFSKLHQNDYIVLEQLTEAMKHGKRGFVTLIETTYNDDDTTKEILNRQLEKLNLQIHHNCTLLNELRQPRTQPVPIHNATLAPPRPSNPSSYKSPTVSRASSFEYALTPSPNTSTMLTPVRSPRISATEGGSSNDSEEDYEHDEDTDDETETFNPADLATSM
jgi:hypothetical protein